MQAKLRKIGKGYGVLLPKQVIERLRLSEGSVLNLTETSAGIELSLFDADFSEQVEAFRRTETRHQQQLSRTGVTEGEREGKREVQRRADERGGGLREEVLRMTPDRA